MFSGTTVDLSEFQRLRSQTRTAAIGLCQRAAHEGAKAGRDHAKKLAPVGTYHTAGGTHRGGQLKREITIVFDRALPFGSQWEMVAPTPYARFVEEDTKAHWIRPRAAFRSRAELLPGQTRRKANDYGVGRGSFLRWYGPGGVAHFAKAVMHPGTTAQPFMAPGGVVARETMVEVIEDGWVRIGARWN